MFVCLKDWGWEMNATIGYQIALQSPPTEEEADDEGAGHARGAEQSGVHRELHEREGERPPGEEGGDGAVVDCLGAGPLLWWGGQG